MHEMIDGLDESSLVETKIVDRVTIRAIKQDDVVVTSFENLPKKSLFE